MKKTNNKQEKCCHLTPEENRRLRRAIAANKRAKASGDPARIAKTEVDCMIAYGAVYFCLRAGVGAWWVWHSGEPAAASSLIAHLRPRDEARLCAEASAILNLSDAQIRAIPTN